MVRFRRVRYKDRIVYNICSKCGKRIKTRMPDDPELAKWLQESKDAVCNICDPASSWERVKTSVVITPLPNSKAILIKWRYHGSHQFLIPESVVLSGAVLEYVNRVRFSKKELEKIWRKEVIPELKWWLIARERGLI